MYDLDARPLALAQRLEAQPTRGHLQVLDADVDAEDLAELPLRQQPLQELAAAAAQVQHAAGTRRLEHRNDTIEAELMQTQRLF